MSAARNTIDWQLRLLITAEGHAQAVAFSAIKRLAERAMTVKWIGFVSRILNGPAFETGTRG